MKRTACFMNIFTKIKCGLLGVVILISGCDSFLEVDTPDNLVQDEFWQNRDQVYSSLMGIYTSLNGSLNSLHVWGDIRSSLYAPGVGTEFTNNYSQFLLHDIYSKNDLVSWSQVYKSITWINSFIKNAPGALSKDPTFEQDELNTMMGEAYAVRALYYFYLVRAFKDVPIIKEPYESDSQEFNTAPFPENEVLDFIEEDLDFALKNTSETFENVNEKYGRVTKNAVRAILADVKLWRNEYQACLDQCTVIDATYAASLVRPLDWYTIFNPGNSSESIFELQYTQQGPSSPLYNWFSFFDVGKEKYLANAANIVVNSVDLYPPESEKYSTSDTIRLKSFSAYNTDAVSNGYGGAFEVYKYLGQAAYQEAYRSPNERTANYIFYRYREILLMKAEAYAMLGKYTEAEACINLIREHCDIPSLQPGEAGEGIEFFTRLLMEREFELGFEGKEWFAAVRVSRRPGYQTVLIDKAATEHSMGQSYQVIRARLLNPESWFLPYYYDEVENNQQLEQKEFFQNK